MPTARHFFHLQYIHRLRVSSVTMQFLEGHVYDPWFEMAREKKLCKMFEIVNGKGIFRHTDGCDLGLLIWVRFSK